jgi:hypothetical protein
MRRWIVPTAVIVAGLAVLAGVNVLAELIR